MLAEGLPHALNVNPHEYQQQLVTLTKETLEGARQEAVRASSDLAVQATSAEERYMAAEEVCIRASTDVEAKKTNSQMATSAVAANQKEHKLAEDAKRAVLAEHDGLRDKKASIDSVVAALEQYEGGVSSEPPLTQVVAFLESMGAEKALVVAVPGALGATPAQRQGFDVVVMDWVKKTLVDEAAAANAALAAAAPAERDIAAQALGAWAVLDVARDRASEADSALAEAQATLAEALAEREAASAQRSGHLVQQTLAEACEERLKGALGALERLISRQAGEVDAATAATEAPAKETDNAMEVDAKGIVGDAVERENLQRIATPMGA